MKLLGLPGRMQSTFPLMEALVRAVDVGATNSHVQAYGFWNEPASPALNPAPEAVIAAATGADAVIAKSFGTRVTTLAESAHGFRPKWCVFIGAPLNWLAATGATAALRAQPDVSPTLFIQQTADPTGAFRELAALVPASARATLVEVPGNDHVYDDTAALARLIDAWVAGLRR
jgi:predicted alpha/beta-hydrolase family hydrolase